MALGVLTVLLLVLGLTIDALMGVQVRRDLHDRLMATAARADALAAAGTAPDQLVAQIGGGGVRALLVTPDGVTYGDNAIDPGTTAGPTAPPPPPPPPAPQSWGPPVPPPPPGPPPDATATVVVHPLRTGGRMILVADTTATSTLMRRLRETMIVGGLLTLAIAALLLLAVTGAALRPLDRLTELARAITAGNRGGRLSPLRPETELGRAATAFDGMLDALEASEHRANHSARSAQLAEATTRQFLADAAHELRTPIAGIRAAAEQLMRAALQVADTPASEGQQRRAALVLNESRRASKLISDMLDLSRIDSDPSLDLVSTDLVAIVEAECERARLLSPELEVVRTGDPAVTVHADPARATQILANLVDNARRYTPPGQRITIDVRRTSADSQNRAELTVSDSGPGIAAADRERIFDRLVRLDSGRDRDHGGSGLGLAIARALAESHHGTLVCLPRSDGAEFRLSLPVVDVGQLSCEPGSGAVRDGT